MSYPYPQDRHRDRKEKGEHPYKDAKEAFAQERAEIQTEAEYYGETHFANDEDRERAAAERLAAINREVRDERSSDA
jgi:hypothetical protein